MPSSTARGVTQGNFNDVYIAVFGATREKQRQVGPANGVQQKEAFTFGVWFVVAENWFSSRTTTGRPYGE